MRLRLAPNAVRIAAALLGMACTQAVASAETILFVGNSFTFGAESRVSTYRPETVTDLNHDGMGGIPALFKAFTSQAGFDYEVSLETVAGANLDFHYEAKFGVTGARMGPRGAAGLQHAGCGTHPEMRPSSSIIRHGSRPCFSP